MGMQVFNAAGLATLDESRFAKAFDQAIKRAVQDARDRPGCTKVRKVTVVFEVVPTAVDLNTAELEAVDISYGFQESWPSRASRKINCGVKKNDSLVFNDLSPQDVNQRTFDVED